MAQIMIDTDSEPIAGLMLLSRLLTDYASMRAVAGKALADSYVTDFRSPQGNTNQQAELYAKAAAAMANVDPSQLGTPDTRVVGMLPALGADYASPSEPDPAKLFGKFGLPSLAPVPTGTNVVPLFPQPALNLPGATGPAVLDAPIAPSLMTQGTSQTVGTLTTVSAATAPTLPPNAPILPVAPVVVLNADVDSAGLPWDERIHSSSKAKKGDGTWKIKRGLEDGVAQAVTAELMAKKLAHTATAPLAGTLQTGVALVAANPLVPLPPTVPVPPGATGMPVAPVPGQPANVPANIPTPPQAPGAVPVAPVSPVARFREMMSKISAGLGSKAITQENVKAAHEGVGLQQLQQAVLHPEKIPDIERALGLSS